MVEKQASAAAADFEVNLMRGYNLTHGGAALGPAELRMRRTPRWLTAITETAIANATRRSAAITLLATVHAGGSHDSRAP